MSHVLKKILRRYNVKLSKKKILLICGVFAFLFFYYFLISPALVIASEVKQIPERIKPIQATLVGSVSGMELSEDIEFLVFELEYFRESIKRMDDSASRLRIFSFIPFVGGYFKDLKTLSSVSLDMVDVSIEIMSSMENSIPSLHFEGWGSIADPSKSTFLEASSVLADRLPGYKQRIWLINKKFESINPEKYPEEIRGIRVRDNLKDLKVLTNVVVSSYDDFVNLVGYTPQLVGGVSPKTYLFLLQDESRLKSSGGTPLAYAVIVIDKGNLKIVKSGDIQILSPALADYPQSADFKNSSLTIKELWATLPDKFGIDGIIVLDKHFIATLLDVVGDVEISDDQVFTSSNVNSELEKFSQASGSRTIENKQQKNLISTLLFELMKKSLSVNTQQRIDLARKVYEESQQKHLLLYFTDENIQKIVEGYYLGGRIRDYNGDYLYVNGNNLQTVDFEKPISLNLIKEVFYEETKLLSKVSIQYTNALSPNYHIKVYVPKGSKLIEQETYDYSIMQGEEYEKTVFEIRPIQEFTTQISFTYEIPGNLINADKYELLIQKQPGLEDITYKIEVANKIQEDTLVFDKEVKFSL